jgi:hypothetical protein
MILTYKGNCEGLCSEMYFMTKFLSSYLSPAPQTGKREAGIVALWFWET